MATDSSLFFFGCFSCCALCFLPLCASCHRSNAVGIPGVMFKTLGLECGIAVVELLIGHDINWSVLRLSLVIYRFRWTNLYTVVLH
jgi:hypothetical protein